MGRSGYDERWIVLLDMATKQPKLQLQLPRH
jgi:hypothetical protein